MSTPDPWDKGTTLEGEVVREPEPAPAPAKRHQRTPATVSHLPTESTGSALSTQVANPLDLPTEVFQAGLDRRGANRTALMKWIKGALVLDVDFGRIHTMSKSKCQHVARGGSPKTCPVESHFSKPSLFKPGAEKICGMLGVSASFPTIPNYEAAALQGVEIKSIILRCELRDASEHVVGEGVGARDVSKDYGDLNKALKMAEKSAMIDACLRMGGLSEVFTQDIEDMSPPSDSPAGNSDEATANGSSTPRESSRPEVITARQHQELLAFLRQEQMDPAWALEWLQLYQPATRALAEMTPHLYESLRDRMDGWAAIECVLRTHRADRTRAMTWVKAATHGKIQHLADLTEAMRDRLADKIAGVK